MTPTQACARALAAHLARLLWRDMPPSSTASLADATIALCCAHPLPPHAWSPTAALEAYETAASVPPNGPIDARLAAALSRLLFVEGLTASLIQAKRALAARLPASRPWSPDSILDAYLMCQETIERQIRDCEVADPRHPASEPTP